MNVPAIPASRDPSDAADSDVRRAEELLHGIAVKLTRVALDGPGRDLHVRALAMKREVDDWLQRRPDDPTVRRVLEALAALDAEAREALLARHARRRR